MPTIEHPRDFLKNYYIITYKDSAYDFWWFQKDFGF